MVRVAAFHPRLMNPLQAKVRSSGRKDPGTAAESTFVSISDEARKLLQGQASPAEAKGLLAAMQETVDARTTEIKQLAKAGRNPAKRIADAKEKLQHLLQRMRQAALLGDKRSAALIAKEAAALARELAAAVKEAAAEAREQGSAAPAEPIPVVPTVTVSDDRSASGAPGLPQTSAAEDMASEQAMTQSATIPSATTQAATAGVEATRTAVAAALQEAQASPGALDEGLAREVTRAMILVRSILAMAKATLARKDPVARADAHQEAEYRKTVEEAEDQIREAATAIREAAGPSQGSWSAETTALFIGVVTP